ncbi:MAG: hypothetical protein DRJ51_03755 [Thermoprotei archaeon]|nr:MAG: hypothetical protein DRJ51_03755 [Thermoprotei archaeon]
MGGLRALSISRNSPKVFITGRPGIGKTTAILKIVELCKRNGLKIGGMVTKEIRERGVRTGFQIIDLMGGRRGLLASIYASKGPRVGKYRVILEDLESVGVEAIEQAIAEADVVFIDEIGPMELFSQKFQETVVRALESPKPLIGTVHIRARAFPFTRKILEKYKPLVIELSLSNRNRVPFQIYELLRKYQLKPSSE